MAEKRSAGDRAMTGATWLWGATVVVGMGLVFSYQSTPGASDGPSATWPKATAVPRSLDRPTLVMIAHPRCSCTRASLSELSVLLDRLSDKVAAKVLLVDPEGAPPGFADTDIAEEARRLRGVEVIADAGGIEAERFGASTSGHVLLYDREGRLVFSGGITGARGHRGDNLGRSRLEALISGQAVDRETSPVFGCALKGGEQNEPRP